MDTYASSLGPSAPAEQHAQVAVCFQNVKEHFKAAAQFELAGNQLSAVSQYMAHAKKVLSSLRECHAKFTWSIQDETMLSHCLLQ